MFTDKFKYTEFLEMKKIQEIQYQERKKVSTNMDYKNDGEFGIIVTNENPCVLIIDENNLYSKDYMSVYISRYVYEDDCIYGSKLEVEDFIIDFLLTHPNALEYIIENTDRYETVIEYLKLYFIHNEKNYTNMIRCLTRILDVLNPYMIKQDGFKFNKMAEEILMRLKIK